MQTKILILLIALLPLSTFAGVGERNKKKIDIHIVLDKKGKVEVSGLPNDMKDLENDINKALKDVTIKVDDGNKKHDIHFKADIKID